MLIFFLDVRIILNDSPNIMNGKNWYALTIVCHSKDEWQS
jgi:hypothetical protein